MTTPADELLPVGAERRLHPMSWLFVLLGSLRELALPIIALLVFGRSAGDWLELLGAIAAVALAAHAVLLYFTYRFRIDRDELVIRSGLLHRTRRHIPFRRVHNVTLHQGLLHRLFGVAQVELESAGGTGAEARMRVLRLADARALEEILRRRAREQGAAAGEDAAAAAPEPELLHALDTGEVLRLGLVSNRGIIALAAIVGALAQAGSEILQRQIRGIADPVFRIAEQLPLGPASWLAGAAMLLVGFALLLQLLSVVLAFLHFHGFRLLEVDGRLQAESGLLSRVRASAPPGRIQAFSLREGVVHRLLGRRSLRVDTAVGGGQEARSLRDLLPVAEPERADALIQRFLPAAGWPDLPWRPLHPRAWRRLLLVPGLATAAGAALLALRFGPAGLWLLALLPVWVVRARLLARAARYAVTDRVGAVRWGWLHRRWRFAEIRTLQALRLTSSPFDRRHGMASLWLDTAGAGASELPLRLPFLPESDARQLLDAIGARLAATRLRW